ncbi:mannose-6-phosphate receptor binding domain-containing protein [Fomes fomentarius]|nr:mannose-6-phosphate receptor binding domain-containing protein [Fomes fomentarius]
MLAKRARHFSFLCVSVLLLSSFGKAIADEKPCTTHADGNYYDLNRLTSRKDYEFTSSGGQKYILNVCKAVSHEVWAPKVDKPEDVAGFTRRTHGDFSIGDANTTVVVSEGQPLIFMTDGSHCPNAGDLTASTAIRFICDGSAGIGEPKMIATLPPEEDKACAFVVEWRTEMACPTSEGSVFGTIVSVMAIIVAVVFALYIVGGTLYNRYVLELRGMDQIPRFSFFSFSDTVELVHECLERVKGRSSDAWQSRNWGAQNWGSGGSWGSSDRQGYSGLRATPEESQTMLGGPPGFLDEQSDEDEEAPPPCQEDSRPSGLDADGVIRL